MAEAASTSSSETEYHYHHDAKHSSFKSTSSSQQQRSPTLVELCRRVINANLERYPPESFGILGTQEWQSLMKLRFTSTRPKHAGAGGGLDGTGRLVPCVSHKFLLSVEEANPEFADCPIVDDMLWKACVEFKFKRGGLTRPQALLIPWPLQIVELQQAVEVLQKSSAPRDEQQSALVKLRSSPMNVALLRDSGVGKAVKKILKKMKGSCKDAEIRGQLEELLNRWVDMAESSGVGSDAGKGGFDANGVVPTSAKKKALEQDIDLRTAESCMSWRQLFARLKNRNEKVMQSQGKRMREKRQNLANSRPKLVKVRPASNKQQCLLKETAKLSTTGNSKIKQIRSDAMVQSARLHKQSPSKKSFGDAVAFASISSKGSAHKRKMIGGTSHSLGAGKRMKIPDAVGARSFPLKSKTPKK